MRRAARTDGPHAAIVRALRQMGCDVLDLSRVGEGCADLLVYRKSKNQMTFLEVKSARGHLSLAQLAFKARFPVHVVRSVDDALTAMGFPPKAL